MTHDEIYKYYKHGGIFPVKGVSIEKIHIALKMNGIQNVIVKDSKNNDRLFVYIPEENKFYRIC